MGYKQITGVGSVLRALVSMGAVVALATGVTFAALQSQQATLANNTISSATADLRIGTSPTSFAASRTGFEFKDVVPGGIAMPASGHVFYLKNYGTAELALKVAVSSLPVNPSGVDLTKVSLLLTRTDSATTQTLSVQELVDAFVTGGVEVNGTLAGGAVGEYSVRVSMAADAFSGQSALVDDIDLVFSGTAL